MLRAQQIVSFCLVWSAITAQWQPSSSCRPHSSKQQAHVWESLSAGCSADHPAQQEAANSCLGCSACKAMCRPSCAGIICTAGLTVLLQLLQHDASDAGLGARVLEACSCPCPGKLHSAHLQQALIADHCAGLNGGCCMHGSMWAAHEQGSCRPISPVVWSVLSCTCGRQPGLASWVPARHQQTRLDAARQHVHKHWAPCQTAVL